MNVKNCKKCGKIFNYIIGPPYCPACREAMEEKFQEVKKYVQQNKQAEIGVIADECDVEMSQIHQWIREERLFFTEDSIVGINCEICGAMIKTGRYCDRCKQDMARGLSNTINSKQTSSPAKTREERENPKMRFLDR